ncbi:hypothetical protein PN499_24410 [Kamptonema animale CS-326]|nr:hypothetical protein [Kamptonema animale]MDB9514348.1 hypothetical protein [Kamptonema animale CS-326]
MLGYEESDRVQLTLEETVKLPNGHLAAWIVREGENFPRLTNCYPTKK